MSARDADMSTAAVVLYKELYDAGMVVPDLDGLQQYRQDVYAGFDPWVQTAVAAFDGEIEDVEVAGIACKQLTPSNWSETDGACIQYAYGGGYISGSCHEDLIITGATVAVPPAREKSSTTTAPRSTSVN
ncbi:MAG: hypothetical protein GY785_15300 [Gammaproteobacteria bacterium]|nr:hypothetical protein [Gammaproteobacteria bacterium]